MNNLHGFVINSPVQTCLHQYPGRTARNMSFVLLSGLRRLSPSKGWVSSCDYSFPRPARCSLTLRPAYSPVAILRLLHRKLRQLHCFHCRFDCYRLERRVAWRVFSPLKTSAFSRRTFTFERATPTYFSFINQPVWLPHLFLHTTGILQSWLTNKSGKGISMY